MTSRRYRSGRGDGRVYHHPSRLSAAERRLAMPCRCGAQPGQPCRRVTGSGMNADPNGQYFRYLKAPHPYRGQQDATPS